MNKKGFTLVELLATLLILGIVVSITVYSVVNSLDKAKKNSEDIFVNTLNDAIKMYLKSDGSNLTYNEYKQGDYNYTIKKGSENVKVYKASENISFDTIMNSSYKPLSINDFVNPNPVNKNSCNKNAKISLYRDRDYVYYYSYNGASLECLVNNNNDISNLPELELKKLS